MHEWVSIKVNVVVVVVVTYRENSANLLVNNLNDSNGYFKFYLIWLDYKPAWANRQSAEKYEILLSIQFDWLFERRKMGNFRNHSQLWHIPNNALFMLALFYFIWNKRIISYGIEEFKEMKFRNPLIGWKFSSWRKLNNFDNIPQRNPILCSLTYSGASIIHHLLDSIFLYTEPSPSR